MVNNRLRTSFFVLIIFSFFCCQQALSGEKAEQAQRPIIAFDLHGVVLQYEWLKIVPTLFRFDHKWALIRNLYKLPFRRLFSIARRRPSFEQLLQTVGQENIYLRDLLIELSVQQRVNREVAQMIQRLRDRGYTLHVLSNIGAESFRRLQIKFAALFHCFTFVLTANPVDHHGALIRKPDAAFFTHYLERVKARAANIVFIDDRRENVEAARRIGMRAIHFKNAEQLTAELTNMGIAV